MRKGILKRKTLIQGMVLLKTLSSVVHHDGTSALYEALSSDGLAAVNEIDFLH